MCEYVSVVATTKGPLQLYANPELDSHGEAREGWGVKDGAEVEWTYDDPSYLTVRYEDELVASTICQMILDKYKTRQNFINSIKVAKNCYRTVTLKNGKYHSYNDKPAVVTEDGDRLWYTDGKRNRGRDRPAVISCYGTKEWYKNGLEHRSGDKPAIVTKDGYRAWFKSGVLHRARNRPAVVNCNGEKEYYIKGKSYNPKKAKKAK